MAKSLPPVSAKVIADAEQFIAEFKRADNASRRSAGNINNEVDKLTKNLKRKFGVADFGKDLLRGFGIGSGFAVAEKAAELLVGHFERAAKAAQDIEESTAKQVDYVRELIRLRQTDEQQLGTMIGDMARLDRENKELQAPKPDRKWVDTGWRGGGKWVETTRPANDAELLAAQKKVEEMKALAVKIEQARQKIAGTEKTKATADSKQEMQDHMKALKDEEEARQKIAAAIAKQDAEMDTMAAKYREVADPSLKFKNQIEEINMVLASGRITAEQAAAAIDSVKRAWEEAVSGPMNKVRDDIFGPFTELQEKLDEQSKKAFEKTNEVSRAIEHSVGHAADAMGDAWVDAINGVEGAWGDLGSVIAREIEGIIAKILIVVPLMNLIGGIFGGLEWASLAKPFLNYGGARAGGGDVEAGKSYLVGEDGPELRTFGSGGTIIPNHKLVGGQGGNIYNIDARGADQGAVERLQSALFTLAGPGVVERRALAASGDSRRRGGSY